MAERVGPEAISTKPASARLQNTEYFSKPPAFQIVGEMVDHQAADNHIEGRFREGKLLDQADIKDDLRSGALRLFAG